MKKKGKLNKPLHIQQNTNFSSYVKGISVLKSWSRGKNAGKIKGQFIQKWRVETCVTIKCRLNNTATFQA